MYNKTKKGYIRSLKQITQQVLKRRVKYIKSCGGSDARYFTEKDIPAVNFGLIGKNHHKQNEYVDIRSFGPYCLILEKFIKEHCT
jgi:succinyl-diaminopimelate desuccinylase